MFVRLLLFIPAILFAINQAWCATVELIGNSTPHNLVGFKIEGEIQPGDARKVLTLYEYYGPAVASNVYLWSPGGDVEEAMKIGRIIRRLRLETWVSDRYLNPLDKFGVFPSPANDENSLCASACVLIWAAGATRQGNVPVLHRPFIVAEDRSSVSDIELESAEKQLIETVRDYLKEMEFPVYYVEKMIATSSQDGYVPTEKDLDDHPIGGMPPSIEEIVLSKCETLTESETEQLGKSFIDKYGPTTKKRKAASNKLFQQLWNKSTLYNECASRELNNLRLAAWTRENEIIAKHKCVGKEGKAAEDCEKHVIDDLGYQASSHRLAAKPGDKPAAELSIDTSMFEEK
jgi:hypothetical protein